MTDKKEDKSWFEAMKDKAASLKDKAVAGAKKAFGKTTAGRVWSELNKGNKLKIDMEQAKVTEKSEHHADNYAHRLADAKIAQEGVVAATISLGIGVAKEVYDFTTKVWNGQDVKDTLDDCKKDMKNNLSGLSWGLKNPNGNAEEWLAELDLDSNTFREGYDNGIAQCLHMTPQEREQFKKVMENQRTLADAKVKTAKKIANKAKTTEMSAHEADDGKVPFSPQLPEDQEVISAMMVWKKDNSSTL